MGLRREDELQQLADALLNGEALPQLRGVGSISVRTAGTVPAGQGAGPRSHG